MTRDLQEIKESVVGDAAPAEGDAQPPTKSAATLLVEMARNAYDLGVSDSGEPFGIPKKGPKVVYMLRGGKASLRGELARNYFRDKGRVAPQQALSDALATLEGFALEQEPTTLYQRVAKHDGALWIDLGCSKGRVVKIEPGAWTVVDKSPVMFKRTPLTGALPTPHAAGHLDELWSWVHATPEDRPLLAAYLVGSLIPDIAHPVLGLFGEQGSGKTTGMKATVLAVDPGPVPYRKPPRDADSWVTAASGSWVVALDNVSHVPDWLSDTLCRAVTGEGDVRRRLYSDSELATFAFRRVIALTGIDLGSLNGDLADRLLPVHLDRISESERREETSMWGEAWTDAHPRIFGAVLNLAADVLTTLRTTKLTRMPRMADFARVLHAVDQTLGTTGLDRYLGAQGRLAIDTLSGDDFISAVTDAITTTFEGTAAELLTKVTPTEDGWRRPKGWPANARLVTQRLRRQAPVLRKVGWEVSDDGGLNKSNATLWTLAPPPPPPTEMARNPASPSSPSSPPRQGRNGEASQGESGESGEEEASQGEEEARKAKPLTRHSDAPDSRQARQSREEASQASKTSQESRQSLHDRALSLVAELRHLEADDLRQRWRDSAAKIDGRLDIPTHVLLAGKTQPVQTTATLELIATDLLAEVNTRQWNEYLTAARAAFDAQGKAAA
jgi:hypothetical protein